MWTNRRRANIYTVSRCIMWKCHHSNQCSDEGRNIHFTQQNFKREGGRKCNHSNQCSDVGRNITFTQQNFKREEGRNIHFTQQNFKREGGRKGSQSSHSIKCENTSRWREREITHQTHKLAVQCRWRQGETPKRMAGLKLHVERLCLSHALKMLCMLLSACYLKRRAKTTSWPPVWG